MITYGNVQFLNQPTYTPRQLVAVDVTLSSNTYNWIVYTPFTNGDGLNDYFQLIAPMVQSDIERKEIIWSVSPHTEEITDPFTGEVSIVDIPKDRIVCPTIPDYIELIAMGNPSQEQLDLTLAALGEDYWQYPLYAKRIVAPVDLILDDIGIKMYGWFQINNLPILKLGTSVNLYCNEILPQHQAIVDQLQGLIIVENRP